MFSRAGTLRGATPPACITADRNENITRRASARRVRWRAFFGGFERRARGNDVGTLHVQNIVKRHGMKDGRYIVVSVITAIADAQKQVHLRRRYKLKPSRPSICAVRAMEIISTGTSSEAR